MSFTTQPINSSFDFKSGIDLFNDSEPASKVDWSKSLTKRVTVLPCFVIAVIYSVVNASVYAIISSSL